MDWDKALMGASPVSLEEMLEAREKRAFTQRSILAGGKKCLISFTLNMPGEYKVFPLAEKAFEEGKRHISRVLKEHFPGGFDFLEERAKTGLEAFYSLDADAVYVKTLLSAIEEAHPLGRLFDIDVLDENGSGIHRTQLGGSERSCLICGKPVWACARSRAHSSTELLWRSIEIMSDYFDGCIAEDLAQKAVRALLTEVCVTPKPGLVDRADNGAHDDMGIFHFVDSACALFPYFRSLAMFALRFEGEGKELLKNIRFFGMSAEDEMFRVTGGVNTHKGAIFSMGIVCTAAAYLLGRGETLSGEKLFSLCGEMSGCAEGEVARGENTNGKTAYKNHGVTGIRGEAAKGFPAVSQCALPVYRDCVSKGYTAEEAAVTALLHLVSRVDDTNMIHRVGFEAMKNAQKELSEALENKSDTAQIMEYAGELNRQFSAKRMSPGGCADLLAVTVFVDSLLK